jgi:putative transposase
MSAQLQIGQGAIVNSQGDEYIITHVLDLDSVLAKSLKTGEKTRLRIGDLKAPSSAPEKKSEASSEDPEFILIPEEDWQEANRRYNIIRPILTATKRTSTNVKKAAAEAKVHPVTIYRWLNSFELTGKVSALVPSDKNGGRGQSRLSEEVETIVRTTIENEYLDKPNRSISKTILEIERLCRNAKLMPPHANTVRNRIADISDERKIAGRRGKRAAREKYAPAVLSFPGADYPLSVVQIDHTELDIMVVDEVNREAICRPWITLAIDVYSRMVLGFFIALEEPSAMSVGMCLSNAILPKDKLLTTHNINTPWNCWGLLSTIHADNGKDFRGEMVRRACQQYGIDLVWRPVGRPHFGGHIERLMRTFNDEIHDLPGTTFSNPTLRGEYDSEKNAVFTLPELEKWLTRYIVGVYHQKYRDDLFMSPLKKYEQGLLGDSSRKGRGLPPKIIDENRLRFDFMPHFDRTIQRTYGVGIDNITYYSDILRPFIGLTDPEDPRLGQRFLFRRDPRNIREIYFFHPEFEQYYAVPYRNTAHPPISIWELRAIHRRLEEQGRKEIDEDLIFRTYEEMRSDEELARKETKKIRREKQKRAYYSQIEHPAKTVEQFEQPEGSEKSALFRENKTESVVPFSRQIKPFDDLEKL